MYALIKNCYKNTGCYKNIGHKVPLILKKTHAALCWDNMPLSPQGGSVYTVSKLLKHFCYNNILVLIKQRDIGLQLHVLSFVLLTAAND